MKHLHLVLTFLFAPLVFSAEPPSAQKAEQPSASEKPDKPEKPENIAALRDTIDHFARKDYEKAEQGFRSLLEKDLTTSMVGKVRFNLGLTLKVEKKYADAVKAFESILTSNVNDRERGENLMEEFMNYRYRSCLQISCCYEAQNEFAKALAATEMARDKYRYEAHCGTCAGQAKTGLDARLADLSSKVKK
jgi:tetratricopeptide (TPR) repeat protein